MLQRRIKDGDFQGLLFQLVHNLLDQRNFGRALDFFIASFSRNQDDLYQWRAYAENGHGVAIGFAPALFQPVDATSKDPTRNVFVGPVLYDDAITRERNAKGLNVAGKVATDAAIYAYRHLRYEEIGKEFLRRLALNVVASPLLWNAMTCKHNGYQNEAEVRLVMLGEKKRFGKKVLQRKRGADVIPYVPYALSLKTPGSIAEIVIGPAAPATAEANVQALLLSYGAIAKVRRSGIPYRAA